ncbi:MAG TPA: tetratricopeptide repeat protein, partial [Phycisphaerae bacterium]|nr:tetratricopeptide repeat protein [Phycisphaerae bacterium]
ALEAIGEYRWIIPMNIAGDIVIRIEAEDRAGNRDYLETRAFTIERAPNAGSMVHVNRTISLASARDDAQKVEATGDASPVAKVAEKSQPDQVVSAFALLNDDKEKEIVVEKEAAERARKEYDLGTWHRLRGEYDIAIRRYRDALAANPGYYQARNDLAGTLLALDRIDEASHEYERILEKDERYAPALEGLSLAQIKRRRYRSAHDTLERLLRVRPKDPEAWLHFGDVCMFMGDRRGARDAWRSATECDRAAASLKTRAERRLAIYQRDRLGAAD